MDKKPTDAIRGVKKKYVDIDAPDSMKDGYLEILNSDYLDTHPGEDLGTAWEILYGDGISNFFDSYPFTHEQALEIKRILERDFESHKVKLFLLKLRDILEGAACLLNQPDYKTYKNDRKIMMATLAKAKQFMDSICDAHAPISRHTTFQRLVSFNEDYETGAELASDCQELALNIGLMMGILIRKLKRLDERNEKAVKGRPTADSKGIIAEIARIWEFCFQKKPTKYIDGPFESVIQIILEGLKLPHKYPQRKISAALKSR